MVSTATSGTPACGMSGMCYVYDAFGNIVEVSSGSNWKELWRTMAGIVTMAGTTPSYAQWSSPAGGTVIVGGNSSYFSYLHKDWLGNARIISSLASASVTTDRAFAPYGEMYDVFGSTGSQYNMFAGTTNSYYTSGIVWDTPNRELSENVGRWLSPDPSDSGWNQYAYPTNPNSFSDPLGLAPVSCKEVGCTEGQTNYGGGAIDALSGWISYLGQPLTNAFGTVAADGIQFGPIATLNSFAPLNAPTYDSVIGDDGDVSFTLDSPEGGLGVASMLTIQGWYGSALVAANNTWMQGPDPLVVATSMRRAVEPLIPTICGGGGFLYGGKGVTAFGFKGFSGGIVDWDSKARLTSGTLKEAGAGGIGTGFIHTSKGISGLGYVELGEIPGIADWGTVAGKGWAGGYAEGELFGAEVGGGAFANITSMAACH